jgi:diguanylate cyclase (GGDEF)-like protein
MSLRDSWRHFATARGRVDADDPDYLRVIVINLVGLLASTFWAIFFILNLWLLEQTGDYARVGVDAFGLTVSILMVMAMHWRWPVASAAQIINAAILLASLALVYVRPDATFSLALATIYPPIAFLLLDDVRRATISVAVQLVGLNVMIAAGAGPWDAPLAARIEDMLTATAVLTTLGVMMAGYVYSRHHVIARLHSLREELARESIHDPLTGLLNRRTFMEVFTQYLARANREVRGLALLILDIDQFKAYNDTHGHPRGDDVLSAVADALRQAICRDDDVIFRLGGEEFFALFFTRRKEDAASIAYRTLNAVRELRYPSPGGPEDVLTASAGFAWIGHSTRLTPHEIYDRLDQALYQAKHDGRARWVEAEFGPAADPRGTPVPH